MARYTGPVCRICRRHGLKLFLKGERCFGPKCAIERRNYPPGDHGQRRRKLSEYANQLKEKQKSRYIYGVLEPIQQVAERGRQQPSHRLLRLLWYYGVAYRFLFRHRLAGFQVEIDGRQVADDAVLVTVANVETYRGFLPLTPQQSVHEC